MELLPRVNDVPSLGGVLQSDGQLLTETILQVRSCIGSRYEPTNYFGVRSIPEVVYGLCDR